MDGRNFLISMLISSLIGTWGGILIFTNSFEKQQERVTLSGHDFWMTYIFPFGCPAGMKEEPPNGCVNDESIWLDIQKANNLINQIEDN